MLRSGDPLPDPSLRSGHVLIVTPDVDTRAVAATRLREHGYLVEEAADASAARGLYPAFAPEVVILALDLLGQSGLDLIEALRARHAPIAVIAVTAPEATFAARAAVAHHLTSPLDLEQLVIVVDNVVAVETVRREAAELRKRCHEQVMETCMIGSTPEMISVLDVVDRAAASRATVLITGEIGSGKELLACAIHERSPRAAAPFVKLHCAGLAEQWLESELFGHDKDAFEGATMRTDGALALADGGTLFLDEICDLSPAIQVKLVHYLKERKFERVGGTETVHADVRLIAATSRKLEPEVAGGRFRDDLFYRLDAVDIELPPLRDRKPDLPALAQLFLGQAAQRQNKSVTSIDPEAMEKLVAYDWPGNVRELETVIGRAVELATGSTIEPRHLALAPHRRAANTSPPIPGSTIAALERHAILATLKATGGSTARAAQMLGISTRTIQYRLHAYHAAARTELDTLQTSDHELRGQRPR